MQLNSLTIKNFKCFKDITCTFNRQLTVLIGKNGAGKTALLDAAAIAISTYLCGIDGGRSRSIQKEDARYEFYPLGDVIDAQHQFPVQITGTGECSGKNVTWSRALNLAEGKTTVKDAKELIEIAEQMQKSVMEGDPGTILPIMSYYGTGRLYAQKKEKRNIESLQRFQRQVGYTDCMDAASNEKLMLNWFEKMTLKYLQNQQKKRNDDVAVQLGVIERVLSGCFERISGCRHAEIQFDLDTHRIMTEYTDAHGIVCRLGLDELSDGYKNTLSMIADIAYRMAVLNPQLGRDVLNETPGIVLIDEIDLHLHPEWQQSILGDLLVIFPKVQFIVTSHAPAIMNSVKAENIRILDNHNIYSPSVQTYGRDVNSIMREIMGVEERPAEIKELFMDFYGKIDHNQIAEAELLLQRLSDILGETDPELNGARVTLDFEKMQEDDA